MYMLETTFFFYTVKANGTYTSRLGDNRNPPIAPETLTMLTIRVSQKWMRVCLSGIAEMLNGARVHALSAGTCCKSDLLILSGDPLKTLPLCLSSCITLRAGALLGNLNTMFTSVDVARGTPPSSGGNVTSPSENGDKRH